MNLQKNEIIVCENMRYPEGALVVDGYDVSGALLAYPLGGGFQIRIPQEEQRRFARVSVEGMLPLYRRGIFTLESIKGKFAGWTDGKNWNGWAMPRFEFAEAQRLIASLGKDVGSYAPVADAFITVMDGGESEAWPAEIIHLPDGGTVKVYAIGAGSWIWEEADSP